MELWPHTEGSSIILALKDLGAQIFILFLPTPQTHAFTELRTEKLQLSDVFFPCRCYQSLYPSGEMSVAIILW